MMGEEPTPQKGRNTLIPLAIAVPVYFALNIYSIFRETIPELWVFQVWGFMFPLLAITISWIFLARCRTYLRTWIGFTVAFTIIFSIGGVGTIFVVGAIWAGV